MQQRYVVKTLGCKANLYDSQLIEAELQKRGWTQASQSEELSADLCIVNSCTVTDDADRQSRKLAAKLFRDHPSARVVMTGCAAEVDPDRLSSSKGIHYVVGNQNKPALVDLVIQAIEKDKATEAPTFEAGRVLGSTEGYSEMISRHPMDREWPTPESSFSLPPADHRGDAGRTRSFLKIQEGCNSFCTYCIIPYGRGPNRSLQVPDVIKQVKSLVLSGVREIVITGTNIGDYGTDWSKVPEADRLFTAILQETDLQRLRVSSLDPTEITSSMLELMAREPRFCPHFHVSLQSPHSRILKLMKRKYAWEDIKSCLEKVARISAPEGGVFVGMDVITGFPGETAEEFEWTRNSLDSLPWTRLHVFPYSERQGTPATKIPGSVPQSERVRRANVLRELSFDRLVKHHQQVLQNCRRQETPLKSVLFENPTRGPDGTYNWMGGYTPNYIRILVPRGQDNLHNQLVDVHPEHLFQDRSAGDVSIVARVSAAN